MNLLQTLGVEIGARTTGSAEAARAADEIAAALRELGLEPRFQEFPLLGHDPDEPELEIDGERWSAGPCVYAHSTPAEGVEGTLRRYGQLPAMVGAEPAPMWAIEADDGTLLAHVYAHPIGIEGGGAIPFLSFYGPLVTPPSAFVSHADGKRLADKEGARARLRSGGRFVPGRRDRNVLADLPGESEETVVVSAHYDSVWRGPGVIDNASGVEALRRIAERLVGRTHPRSLLFVAFGAEEIGLVGSTWFVNDAKFRGELDRIVGVVNLDCVAHGTKFELMVGPDELRGRAVEAAARLGLSERYDLEVMGPLTGTDHFPFTQEQIPGVSILHFPYPEYHLPEERLELVDERKLDDSVELAVALVETQLARPVPKT
jgi:Iap family predicted aminopeptidase